MHKPETTKQSLTHVREVHQTQDGSVAQIPEILHTFCSGYSGSFLRQA